ncbi:hypothetical protein [Actinomadura bangladeshensis]|uniref:Guanylate cyclase domain-containing protein n=1 Tax=Actinomadura bangladeshensis TaxID=453573 RepID=A0A6L9QIS0_9ACTN|nr:hypothetical protein [Actinomadura bangladeshensis]NEA24573.1 hypothetical protein [Actinomadura bangladeshensis]
MTDNLPAARNVDTGMAAMREDAFQPEDGAWALLRDRLDRPTQSAAVDRLIDQVLTRDDPLPTVDDLQRDLTESIEQASEDDPWWQIRADTAALNNLAQYLLALARVERSSLGAVQAQRLRDQTPTAMIREVLARAGRSDQLTSEPASAPPPVETDERRARIRWRQQELIRELNERQQELIRLVEEERRQLDRRENELDRRLQMISPEGQLPVAATAPSHQRPAWLPSTPDTHGLWTAGANCTIVFTDIAGFGLRDRDDNDRSEMRRLLYAALQESFDESGVPWDACYREDRGDGALIIVPPQVPTAAVIDPMLALLRARLRRHNHRSSATVRIQLRVAMDVGPVTPDQEGMSGRAIITTARLLEAVPLKDRLAATGADLGFITSRFVYDSVIAVNSGYGYAGKYEPIRYRVKETDAEAWIRLYSGPPQPIF